jgi:putative two-component system response regulator
MKTIFVVDNSDTNLSMAETALEDHYRVITIPSTEKMFAMLEKIVPDLILLEVEMPDMDGFEALKRLKSNSWANIPVMFLTGRIDPVVEARGFEMGAVDFVTKPFSAPVLLNRIKTHLDIDKIIYEKTTKLNQLQNSIVTVLANMVESRDKGTSGHIERTSSCIKIMVEEMKKRGVYAEETGEWDIDKIVSAARMHDLGKISVTDIIINKPDKLNMLEFEIMKAHALEGERIIDIITSQTGEGELLHNAKLFAGCHHEHWDGSGYPRGLKGTEIPLQGRIMAIADVYDALVSERPYKKAFTDEEAADIIMMSSGTYFDPKVAEVFYEVKDQIKVVNALINDNLDKQEELIRQLPES